MVTSKYSVRKPGRLLKASLNPEYSHGQESKTRSFTHSLREYPRTSTIPGPPPANVTNKNKTASLEPIRRRDLLPVCV